MEQPIHFHYKLYKPYGFVSQFVSHQKYSHKKKYLGALYPFQEGTMAIGRLDEKSEGLLLLTTDGKVSDFVNSGKVEKEYYAQLDGIISSEAIVLLQKGLQIKKEEALFTTKPCEAKRIEAPALPQTVQRIRDDRHGPTSWISITLTEGKFRQVRKMTAAVGYPTLRLARVRIGKYTIEGMDAGDCIPLKEVTP